MDIIREEMQSHLGTYKRAILSFYKFLDKNKMKVSRESAYLYCVAINKSNLAYGTKNAYIQAMKTVIRRALASDAFGFELFSEYDTFFRMLEYREDTIISGEKPDYTDKYLTKNEIQNLLKKCTTEKQSAYIEFIYMTGIRISEMCNILISDCSVIDEKNIVNIMIEDREIQIPILLYRNIIRIFNATFYLFETSKGKSVHPTYVSGDVLRTSRRDPKKLNRHYIGGQVKKVTDVTPEILRRSFAYNYIQSNPSGYKELSKYMGHSSVAYTMNVYNFEDVENLDIFPQFN